MATEDQLEEKDLSNPENQDDTVLTGDTQEKDTSPKGAQTPDEGVPLPSSVPNVFAKERKASGVPEPVRHKNVDVQSYLDYTGKDINLLTDDADAIRAKNQGWFEQLGAFANQAVVGEIIGGSIEGAGYLLDMQGMVDLAKGTEKEWGNWLSDIGKSIREFSKEATPIYQEDPGTFNPGDSGWWFGNGVSVASTLSLMIPSGLGLKGLSMLGRAMGSLARSSSMGSKLLNAGSKMAKQSKAATGVADDIGRGMTQAVLSRHAENMMESSQFFEEKYQDLLDKGIDEEVARQRASEGAAFVYRMDSAMLLQDIAQYTLLHRFTGGRAITPNNAAKAASAATSKLPGGRFTMLAQDMVTEGAEEAYQHIAQEEAGYISDTGAGVRGSSTFSERLRNYVNDGEMWTAATFGAFGAGLMQTVGPAFMERLQDRSPGFTNDPADFMKNYMAEMSVLDQSIRAAEEQGLEDQANQIKDIAVARMALKNAQMGTEQGHLEVMRKMANMNDQEIEEFVAEMEQYDRPIDPDSIRENAQRQLEISEEAIGKYKEIRNDYGNEVARAATSDYMIAMLNKRRAKAKQDELNDYKTNSEEYNDFGAKDLIDLEVRVKALEKAKETAQKAIDNFEQDEQLSSKYQRASDNISENLEIARQELKKRKNQEYDAQEQKRDQQRRKGLDPFVEKASKIDAARELSDQVSNVSLESFDQKLKIANDKQKKEERKQEAQRKKEFEQNTVPAGENATVKRNTPLKYKGENYRYHSSFERDGQKHHKIVKDGDPKTQKTIVSDEEFQEYGEIYKSKSTVADEAQEEKDTKQSREEQKEINKVKRSKQQEPPPGPDQASGVDAIPPGQRPQTSQQQAEDQEEPSSDPGPPPEGVRSLEELRSQQKTSESQERAQGEVGGNEDIMVPPNPDEEGQSDPHAESTPSQEISKSSMLAVSTASLRNPQSWVRKDLEAGKITEDSERWKDAKAFTEWAENQSPVVNPDGSYRYYVTPEIDTDYMRSSGNFSEEFISKVENRDILKPDELFEVPIKVTFHDVQTGDPVTVNGREVTSYLHTGSFFTPGKFSGENYQAARDELYDQRKAVYSGYRHQTPMKSFVTRQTDGHFLRGENVELGNFETYNNVAEVLNQDISEITLAILNNSGAYTGSDGRTVPQLDLREGDSENRSGAVYAHVIAANGSDKPMRLFADNPNREEANLLYDAYGAMVKGLNPTSTLTSDIKEAIRSSEDPRISGIPDAMGLSIDDISLVDLVNFLVYEGKEVTQNKGESALYKELRGENSVLRFGTEGTITREEFGQEAKKEEFYQWVSNNRRHQITRRLIGDNEYKRYLIENRILTTTAAVTEDGNPLMGASTIIGQFSVDSSVQDVDGIKDSNESPPWQEEDVDDNDVGISDILQKPEISSSGSLPDTLSQRGMMRMLDRLQEKFNIPYRVIDDPNVKWAGRLDQGVAFINTAYATKDTPFHEYAHPLLQSIKNTNIRLYSGLIEELKASPQGREIYRKVRKNYPELSNEQQLDEAIVQSLGELAANNIRQDQTGFKAALQRMWRALKHMMQRIFSSDITVDPSTLSPSMSMQQLSEILTDNLSTIDLSQHKISAEQRRPKWTTRQQYNDWIDFMTYMFVKANTNADISNLEGAQLTTIRDLVKSEIRYLKKNDPESHYIEQYENVLNEITTDGERLNPESIFLNGVKRKLRQFGIKPDQEVDLEDRDSRLNIRASYEFSNKQKASTNVKLMLGMVPQLNSSEKVMNKFARQGEPKPDYKISEHTGLPKMHSFSEMWNVVQGTLSGVIETTQDGKVEDLYKVQIERLQEASTLRPELSFLIEHLQKAPEYKRTQFTTVMSMVDQGFFSTLFRREDQEFTFNFGRSDTQSVSDQILDKWSSSYRNKLVRVARGKTTGERKYIVREDKAKELVERYDDLVSKALTAGRQPHKFDVVQGQVPNELKQELISLLEDTGINVNTRTIEKVLRDFGRGSTSISRFTNILRDTKGSSIRFLYKKPEAKNRADLSLEGMIESPRVIPANEEVQLPITNEAFIRNLAEAESYFQNQLIDNTILGPDNKPFWIYSQYNAMFKRIAEWKRNPESLKKIKSTAYAGNSKWAEWLLDSQENRDEFTMRTLASIRQEFSGDIGKKNTDLGITDLVTVRLNAMLNGVFALPARADNTTEYYIQGPEVVKSYRISEDNNIEASDEAVNIVKDYLLDEVARVKHAENQVKKLDDKGRPRLPEEEWIKDYHYKLDEEGNKDVTLGNAFKIDILPSFNMDGDNAHHIFNSSGETKTLTAQNFYDNPQIDQAIRSAIEEQTKRDLKKMKDHRVITRDADSNKPNALKNRGIDADIISGLKRKGMTETAAIHASIMNYTVNGIIANQEWHKLFGGDIASYKNRADFQKRATGPGSTGVNYRIMDDMKPTYQSAVVSDIIQPSELLEDNSIKEIAKYTGRTQKEVRSLLEDYGNVDRADAQAWITPSQYRDRMRGYGKWTPSHEQAYQRLMDGEQLPEDLQLFMQPLKTVHTEMKIEGKASIFHYNKQSEAVLHPDLAGSMNIGNLLEAMQAQEVDHVVVESGKKVGAQGITSLTKSEEEIQLEQELQYAEEKYGNDAELYVKGVEEFTEADKNEIEKRVREEFAQSIIKDSSDIELNPVALSKRFLFLQQELPTKGMKPAKEGSQLRKNILEGIQPDQKYTLPDGTTMDGGEFLKEMHMAIGSLSDKGLQEVKDLIGWNEGSEKYDPQKLYDFLLDSMTVREENENLINALQQKYPLDAIPQMRVSIENQLASIINKNVVDTKHQTGGAYIQMSDIGWTTSIEGNLDAVRYINDEARNGLKRPRIENGRFKPGQILIPHKVAQELNLNELSDSQLKRVFSKINTGISYRIPNQSMSSNDIVEVAGILPPEMGDTVIAYKEVTTKFGSDFDIDKLNVMLPNYYIKDGEVNLIEFKDIDTNNEEALREVYRDQYQAKIDFIKKLRDKVGQTRANMLLSGIDIATFFETKNEEDIIIDSARDISLRDYNRLQEQIKNIPSEQEFVDQNLGASVYQINSKEAVQNRKLELYRAMLSNPNTFLKMISPLESDWLANSIKLRRMVSDGRITQEQYNAGIDSSEKANDLIDEFYDTDYRDLEAYSPTTQAEIRKTFVDTKAAVGQVANHSTDHPLAQHADLYLNRKDKKGELEPYYIGIGNQTETENGPATSFAQEFDETGESSIAETLSAFMTANVDAAKDPYITDGNFNLFTNNIALFLARAGVTRQFIVDFIGSRGVRNLAKINAEYEGRTAQRYRLKGREISALEYVTYQFSNKETTDINEAVNIEEIDPRQVIKELRESDSREANLKAIALFNHWQQFASVLSQSIQASKADVNGIGPSITSGSVRQNLKDKVIEDGIIGNFERKFDGTFLERFHENSITQGIDIFGKGTFLSYTQGHQDLVDSIAQRLGIYPITDEDIAFKLNSEAYAYIMSGSDFGVNADQIMDFFKGSNSMAQRLMRIKGSTNEEVRSNPLIEYLGVRVSPEENKPDFVYGQGSKQLTEEAQNEITEGWRELLTHDIKEVREFALDLGKYAFYTSGFRRNLTSFHELIPVELNKELGIKDYIEQMQIYLEEGQPGTNPLASATDQILKNLQDDGSIVPRAPSKSPNKYSLGNMKTDKIFGLVPSEFEWLVTGTDDSNRPVMKPYVTVNNNLYEYRGITTIERETNDVVRKIQLGVYTPANELGYKEGRFRIKEYHYGFGDMESIFPENRVGKNEKVEELIRSLGVVENTVSDQKSIFTPSIVSEEISEIDTALKNSEIEMTPEQRKEFADDYRKNYSDKLTPEEFVEIIERDC